MVFHPCSLYLVLTNPCRNTTSSFCSLNARKKLIDWNEFGIELPTSLKERLRELGFLSLGEEMASRRPSSRETVGGKDNSHNGKQRKFQRDRRRATLKLVKHRSSEPVMF